ncbi:MAG: DUF5615 family PIN-like protein [Bacteroidota bacterium]
MKFLIDENISPEVAKVLRGEQLTAYHINTLKSRPKQRVIDDQLRRLSIQKNYIVVTKDDDFVKSYVSRKVPEKMLFVYGIDDKKALIERFKRIAPDLSALFIEYDFVELTCDEVRFPLD